MALQTLPSLLSYPSQGETPIGAIALATATTLDAAGEYECFIFQAREAMVISHVGFKCGAATGSPTADVRIETVGTDGLPTGTLWATNTNIVTATLSANTFALHALTASATVAVSEFVAVKIAYASGTSFIIQSLTSTRVGGALPYRVVNTGTPTKTLLNEFLGMAIGSSTSAFYQVKGIYPFTTIANTAFNNTNGARRGVRFTAPFACRMVGIRIFLNAAAGDVNAVVFDDAGAELSSSSTAIDGNKTLELATSPVDLILDNPVTLAAGTVYRAVIEPSSATNSSISTVVLLSAAYRLAHYWGANAHYTSYASAAWDDTATSTMPYMSILIDQLDDGAGGGGGVVARVIGG